jgi:hypothetical protein
MANAVITAMINAAKSDVESDLATIASPPFITLLTNLAAHKGNKIAQGADVVQFVATAPAAGLALEGELEGQLLEIGIGLIQTEVAKAPTVGNNGAPAAPAPAAPAAAKPA